MPLRYKVFCGKKRVFSIFNEKGTSIRYHKRIGLLILTISDQLEQMANNVQQHQAAYQLNRCGDVLSFVLVEDIKASELSVIEYRYRTLVFGVNSSPFQPNAILRHHNTAANFSQQPLFILAFPP